MVTKYSADVGDKLHLLLRIVGRTTTRPLGMSMIASERARTLPRSMHMGPTSHQSKTQAGVVTPLVEVDKMGLYGRLHRIRWQSDISRISSLRSLDTQSPQLQARTELRRVRWEIPFRWLGWIFNWNYRISVRVSERQKRVVRIAKYSSGGLIIDPQSAY